MAKVIYKAAKGFHLSQEQVDRYGPRVHALASRKQGVSKQEILADARKRNSPLHDYFEWDDTVAAEKFRLRQAGYLLRGICTVVTVNNDPEPKEVRAMHPVIIPQQEQPRWVTLAQILSEQEYHAQVLARALKQLKGWEERYATYEEFDPIREAITIVEESLG